MTSILLDKREVFISKIVLIIYNLSEIDINNKKSLEELLSTISKYIKKSLEELIVFVIEDIILRIREVYKENSII